MFEVPITHEKHAKWNYVKPKKNAKSAFFTLKMPSSFLYGKKEEESLYKRFYILANLNVEIILFIY